MAIVPIIPVTFDPLQGVAIGDGFRDGRILEARVTAVLSNTLARIEIDGQPLMVTTTKPLPVGTALTVKVEREAGQLRLISQGPPRDMPEALPIRLPEPQRAAYGLTEQVRVALAKIQATIGGATPAKGPTGEPSLTQILASIASPQAEDAPSPLLPPRMPLQPGQIEGAPSAMPAATGEDAATPPATRAASGQDAAAPPAMRAASGQDAATPPGMRAASGQDATSTPTPVASGQHVPEGGERVAIRSALPEFRQVHVPPETLGAAGRPERTAISAAEIPLFLPDDDGLLRQAAPSAHLPPRTPLQPGQDDAAPPAPPAASGQGVPESGERSAVRIETPEFRQVHIPSDALGAQGRAERAAIFTVEIPIFLAGNDVPLRLHVTQHEEAAEQENEAAPAPYWTVRFAAEAGRLGMVHAAISLIEGHIGVQLRAEREETADQFKRNAAQLRDALQASDLKLDAVNISQGGPLGDR